MAYLDLASNPGSKPQRLGATNAKSCQEFIIHYMPVAYLRFEITGAKKKSFTGVPYRPFLINRY